MVAKSIVVTGASTGMALAKTFIVYRHGQQRQFQPKRQHTQQFGWLQAVAIQSEDSGFDSLCRPELDCP
jgi:hypothetical protein